MNRLVIPCILAATVLVAGMFAFIPIEKASTVHTTITSQLCTALFGAGTCPAVETPVESNVAAGGATSANINERDGAMFWEIGSGIGAITTLVPVEAGKTITGQVVVSSTVAAQTCTVEDDDGADISVATGVNGVDSDAIAPGTPATFTAGDGLQLLNGVAAGVCTVTIFIDNISG